MWTADLTFCMKKTRFDKPGKDGWTRPLATCKTDDKFERVAGRMTNRPNFFISQSVLSLGAVTLFIASSSFVRERHRKTYGTGLTISFANL